MEGNVKWYNRKKGYGFIEGEDGKEYFVHGSALGEARFIRDNDKVSFEAAETDKGLQAQNVQLLEKGSERSDIAPAEDAPQEEAAEDAPQEEAAEEAPAEEPAAEETPAEEPSAEEAPAEEEKQE